MKEEKRREGKKITFESTPKFFVVLLSISPKILE
jgi:hypothetical protein